MINKLVKEAVPFVENLRIQARALFSNEQLEADFEEEAAEEAERSQAARARLLETQANSAIIALGHQLLYAVLEQPRNSFFVLQQATKAAVQLTGFSGIPYGTNFIELTDLSAYLTILQGAYWHFFDNRRN